MKFTLGALLLLTAGLAQAAGGVYLGTTRVIFDSANKTTTVIANNSSEKDTWLLRSWVSPYTSKNKEASADSSEGGGHFVVTPPLYRLDPKGSVQLRINRTGGVLPEDRESVFYFNALAIPPKPKEGKGSMVQFALNTQIKLFYRPHALNEERAVAHAYKKITVRSNGALLTLSNPTPYYLTVTNVLLDNGKGVAFNDPMIPPFGKISSPLSVSNGTLSYQVINDYGGQTPRINKTF
ncbi:MAG: molecular chaperone [Serratia rubidaea]|nr:molecular chaperone [Serratia rubidaea]